VIDSHCSRLFCQTFGQGEDVVLVHGLGMHGGLLRDFAERLAQTYRVTIVDLPGHGRSPVLVDWSAESIVNLLVAAVSEKAHWIGWSLGATLVLFLSGVFPDRVRSIGMIAGNPRFSAGKNWPHAMERNVLRDFQRDLREDSELTLLRFLKLQTMGMENSRQVYAYLKTRLKDYPPHPDGLAPGVDILLSADLRDRLRTLPQPVLVLLGARDALVPVAVGESISRLNSSIEVNVLSKAGHIPFITHRDQCLTAVLAFLAKHGSSGHGA
jgi:pimeloyl-[acyl-carrier protein] methyl ester esterase